MDLIQECICCGTVTTFSHIQTDIGHSLIIHFKFSSYMLKFSWKKKYMLVEQASDFSAGFFLFSGDFPNLALPQKYSWKKCSCFFLWIKHSFKPQFWSKEEIKLALKGPNNLSVFWSSFLFIFCQQGNTWYIYRGPNFPYTKYGS